MRKSGVWPAAAIYLVLSIAYTWPLTLHLTSVVPHDRGDPLLVAWILWWSTKAVPLTTGWWNAPAFYPSTGVLAFSEHFLGLAPITAPVIALSHDPLLAYNIAFLASFVLSGIAGYVLGLILTGRRGAAFVAGTAFAFAPYRLSHLQHLQLLSSYWMPIALAALHLYVRDRRPRWAALFAAAWLMQALACGYEFFFLTVFVVLWLPWFARGSSIRMVTRLGAAWLVAGFVMLPILLGYRAIHATYGFHRSQVEMVGYSADIAGLLSASRDSLLWPGLHAATIDESELFPGVTAIVFFVAALWLLRRRRGDSPASTSRDAHSRAALIFYAGAAVAMWLLALGPKPMLLRHPVGVPGPYSLLMWLPGFDEMRVPARLWMLSVLSLAALGALVVSSVEGRRRRRWIVVAATIGCLLDGWPRSFPLVAAPVFRLTANAAVARLGLPLEANETETMYGAIPQVRPVFNGYSGYEAPQHPALRDLLDHHDPRILARLAAADPIEILVQSNLDPGGALVRYVAGIAGIRRGTTRPDWTSYVLGPTGAFAPPAPAGERLPVAAIAASVNQHDIGAVLDGDLDTRWHAAAQAGSEAITIDLGGARHVQAVELCLGQYPSQYPRALTVETSPDGQTWSRTFSGGTALETYDGALRDPRAVPLDLPVDRSDVRFLRLRQTARVPLATWTIVELHVIG